MEKKTLAEVIDIAIKREEESISLYSRLHDLVEDKNAKDTLTFLTGQETKHREFLLSYKKGDYPDNFLKMSEVVDYKIAQHLEAPEADKKISSSEVYLLAAHRELSAYNFYRELAAAHPAGELHEILTRIANEELKHKEKVEYLYSNTAFPQTQGG
jgi:rubrerythrin